MLFFVKFQAIGLVENQSDYYLGKKKTPWPAIDRGYDH